MSQLDQLRSTVRTLAENSNQMGNQLAPFSQKFTEETNKVVATIGNTATGQDKKIAATLTAASKSLEQTVAYLLQVKQVADQWAARA